MSLPRGASGADAAASKAIAAMSSTKPKVSHRAAAAARPPARRTMNWFRFWVQMAVAMLVFNIIAGLVTWFFIFPHLHPAH